MYLDVPTPEYLEVRCTKGATEDECWLWWLRPNHEGYGVLSWHGKDYKAHRLAYIVYCGDIPDGHIICHSCDVRHCINPRHLFAGTDQDNTDDKVSKSRQARGTRMNLSNITEEDVVAIREFMAAGAQCLVVAAQFNVSARTVYAIANGQYWKHVGGPITRRRTRCLN